MANTIDTINDTNGGYLRVIYRMRNIIKTLNKILSNIFNINGGSLGDANDAYITTNNDIPAIIY
jgi:hypothetical protein